MDFPEHPFWDFTIETHRKEGVHEACLVLQRDFDLDVNVIFFCCWAGAAGAETFSQDQIEKIISTTSRWQEEIVRPIWRTRWRIKNGFDNYSFALVESLRKELVMSEVNAEHIEQLELAQMFTFKHIHEKPIQKRLADSATNLRKYLGFMFAKPSKVDRRLNNPMEFDSLLKAISAIVQAAFQDASPAEVASQVERHILRFRNK